MRIDREGYLMLSCSNLVAIEVRVNRDLSLKFSIAD